MEKSDCIQAARDKYHYVTDLAEKRTLIDLFTKLILTEKKRDGVVVIVPTKTVYNLLQILSLHPDWQNVFMYNERDMMIYIKASPPYSKPKKNFIPYQINDEDYVKSQAWIEKKYGLSFSSKTVHEVVSAHAKTNCSVDPLLEYLKTLKWDQQPRLDTWLVDYAEVEDSEYTRQISSKYLISAMARTFDPGCKVDTMLILQGYQGDKKSTILSELAGEDYFTDHIESIQDKDGRMQLQGPMIIEFSELDAFSKKERSAIKAFITTRIDRFRPPYAKSLVAVKRRCVFAGTTNDKEFLQDQTGGRRFWPVETGKLDIDGIKKNREQILAEAVHRYKAGEKWWLSDEMEIEAKKKQEEVREKDIWEDMLINHIAKPKGLINERWWPCFGTDKIRKYIAVSEMAEALGIEKKDASRNNRRINATAVAIGLKKSPGRKRISGEKHSVYYVPFSFYRNTEIKDNDEQLEFPEQGGFDY